MTAPFASIASCPQRKMMKSACRLRDLAPLLVLLAAARSASADEVPPCPAPTGVAPAVSTHSVRVVTGAPYSALGTSETVTTLPDGNRVVRQTTIRQWRDS